MLNSKPVAQHSDTSLDVSEDEMPSCYRSSTHLQRASFSHSQDQSHEAGAAEMLHFLQASVYILTSPMGSYSATATMHSPAAAGKAGELVQQQGNGATRPPTHAAAAARGALQSKAQGISSPPCSATRLSCTQEALVQKG